MSPLFLDQLDKDRQQVFKKLKGFSRDFTLAGGTAIMLQIGHRKSFDFDCFTEGMLPNNIEKKAKNVFGKDIYPLVRTKEQLTFKTNKNIEITFVSHPFKSLQKSIETQIIPVSHLDDLAANKAYTIGRRGVWRDYVDLFFFLKWNIFSLPMIIKNTEKKFQNEFNSKLFLQQLVYFDDLAISPINFIKESYKDSEIKSFLGKEVQKYLKEALE